VRAGSAVSADCSWPLPNKALHPTAAGAVMRRPRVNAGR